MPITADILYPKLLEATASSPIGLEKRIGLGNGVIAKAITNRSALRAGTLSLILRAFPNLNPAFLENGSLPLFTTSDGTAGTSSGTEISAAEPFAQYNRKNAEGWKDKYLSLLEQQVRDQTLLLQTATAAIEAAHATVGFVEKATAEFVSRSTFRDTELRLSGLRQFTLQQLSVISAQPIATLEDNLRQLESGQ